MISRQTVLILILFLCSFMAWQWLEQDGQGIANESQKDLSLPSFTTSKLTSYRYNIQGDLEDIFTADQALYFEQKKITEFINPQLNTYDKQTETWQINAKHGQLQQKDQLILRDNIVIKNRSPNINLDKITTNYLAMDLNTHIITSDKPVAIDSDDYHVQGVGLKAELDQKRYQILEQGHATYFNKPRS